MFFAVDAEIAARVDTTTLATISLSADTASLEKAAGARERHPSQAGLEVAAKKPKSTTAKATKATKTAAKAPANKATRCSRSA